MSAPHGWAAVVVVSLLAPALPGCAISSRARLAQCEAQYQTLQTETAKLKDEALALGNANRDLNLRAVEDARRLAALEESNERLTRAAASYRQEREAMAEAFDRIRRSVQVAGSLPPTAMLDRFESLARAHPGCHYDAARGVWTFPAESLFRPGTADWAPGAPLLLDAFARLLSEPGDRREATKVVGIEAGSGVRRASHAASGGADDLARRRAGRVAERLARDTPGATPPIAVETAGGEGATAGVEVRLGRDGTPSARRASP